MKKYILFILVAFVFNYARAQYPAYDTDNKSKMRTAIDLKSGNEQDVLSSFFQLAFDNLQSQQHSFQFQSTLLAWHSRFNPNVYEDTYYKRSRFERNFTFGLGLGTDSTNKFTNKNLSLKYAIINRRDSFLFSTSKLPYERDWSKINTDAFAEYLAMNHNDITNDNVKRAKRFAYPGHDSAISVNDLPADFRKILREKMDSNTYFKGLPLDDFQFYLKRAYERFVATQRKRGLLTIGGNVNFDPAYNLNMEYLKGITNPLNTFNIDLDIRGDYYDSVNANTNQSRQLLKGSAGLNMIFNGSDNTPYLEFKLAVADKYVLSGKTEKGNANTFFLDGTFRLRLINNVWLPIEFTYDPKNGNFAGLLNVRMNID